MFYYFIVIEILSLIRLVVKKGFRIPLILSNGDLLPCTRVFEFNLSSIMVRNKGMIHSVADIVSVFSKGKKKLKLLIQLTDTLTILSLL